MPTMERLTSGQLLLLRLLSEADACLANWGSQWGIETVGRDEPIKVLPEHAEWARERGYVKRLHPFVQVEPLRYRLTALGRGLLA